MCKATTYTVNATANSESGEVLHSVELAPAFFDEGTAYDFLHWYNGAGTCHFSKLRNAVDERLYRVHGVHYTDAIVVQA